MTLRERFGDSLKEAMKARNPKRVSTLRMIVAALKERDIANRSEKSRVGVGDDEILSLLVRMIRQREESATIYESGGRPELAEAEREEIAIIREFLPQQMSDEEMHAAVRSVAAELGAATMKDMGRVMGALKERYAGRLDLAKTGASVKELLAAG